MKICNYNQFILEWGYGGEGGVASKDPIKVKSSMITSIILDEEDEEDEEDIPILQDIISEHNNKHKTYKYDRKRITNKRAIRS